MTEFENILEAFFEEYVDFDSKDKLATWDETDAFVKRKAAILIQHLLNKIDVYQMQDDFIKNATERFRFDSYFYKSGIEDTIEIIKKQSSNNTDEENKEK